jgi:hypothetical protein
MQHDSPFMCLPALGITKFAQRVQYTLYEEFAIRLLFLWKNRTFAFPCAIDEKREHSFLMEM